MSSPTPAPQTATHIPAPYRVFLLYVEPTLALQGAMMCFRSPLWYLSVMSPHANRSHYHPILQVIFHQLSATYFLFAFNQAVVLRVAGNNLRVWKAMVFGMLVCDFLHMYATKEALGWELQLDPMRWRFYDWFNLAVLYGAAALRIAFLAGVGVEVAEEQQQQGAQKKVKAKTG